MGGAEDIGMTCNEILATPPHKEDKKFSDPPYRETPKFSDPPPFLNNMNILGDAIIWNKEALYMYTYNCDFNLLW